MSTATPEDSVLRAWPGAEKVLSIPWPEEQAVIDDLNLADQLAGRHVLAAACLDYAFLSDVGERSRLAWGVGAAAVPPSEREMSAREYQEIYEVPGSEQRVDQAVCQARELAKAVPAAERADTITAGQQFLDLTAGHIAVRHFVETVRIQAQSTS